MVNGQMTKASKNAPSIAPSISYLHGAQKQQGGREESNASPRHLHLPVRVQVALRWRWTAAAVDRLPHVQQEGGDLVQPPRLLREGGTHARTAGRGG